MSNRTLLNFLFPAAFMMPLISYAQTVRNLIYYLFSITQMLAGILVSLAVLVFFWGVVKFIAHADDEKAVAEGKQLIIWGLVGIFVMVALWSIVGYIQESLGLNFVAPLPPLSTQPSTIPVP